MYKRKRSIYTSELILCFTICVLTSNEVNFVSLADTFTVQFSNLLKLPSGMENKQLNGPGNYRELRETGPSSGVTSHKAVDQIHVH